MKRKAEDEALGQVDKATKFDEKEEDNDEKEGDSEGDSEEDSDIEGREKLSLEEVKAHRDKVTRFKVPNSLVNSMTKKVLKIVSSKSLWTDQDVKLLDNFENAVQTRSNLVQENKYSIINPDDEDDGQIRIVQLSKILEILEEKDLTLCSETHVAFYKKLVATMQRDVENLEQYYQCPCICHKCPNCGGDGADCCPKICRIECDCGCSG